MSVFSLRLMAAPAAVGMLVLCSCSVKQETAAGPSESYWSAAAQSYSVGNYVKTADHLEHLLAAENPYAARAIAWRLVLTSGMARGYTDLADRYTAAARVNKPKALELRRTAAGYHAMAARLALQFAQDSDRLRQIPLGNVQLAFALPKGSVQEPPVLWEIGSGNDLSAADREAAETAAVEIGVLLSVCDATGAPGDPAKARQILATGVATVSREAFANTMAQWLKAESTLFARDRLDDPEKLAALQERIDRVLAEGAKVGSARVGLVVNASQSQ